MENILMKTKAPILIHLAIFSTFTTILICYGLAVINEHVPAWLPMISDCGIDAPERYPFRVGLVIAALLLFLDVILSYGAGIGSKNKLGLIVGLVSSVGLAIVAVVNLEENVYIHATGAAAFFFGYEIYMLIMTWYSLGEKKVGFRSLTTKEVCSITGVIALLLYLILASTNYEENRLYIAICEWYGLFCILIFQWTFAFDLSMVTMCQIINFEDLIITQNSKTHQVSNLEMRIFMFFYIIAICCFPYNTKIFTLFIHLTICSVMERLSQVSLSFIIRVGIVHSILTIMICYIIAVTKDHVDIIPMISDCGVMKPERYFFRFGTTVAAAILATGSVGIYLSKTAYQSKLALTLSLLASLSLAVVGIVSQVESWTVHTVASVIFFGGYGIYTWLMTYYSGQKRVRLSLLLIRVMCTLIGGLALAVFTILHLNWEKYYFIIAISEWILLISGILFQLSLSCELQHVQLCWIKVCANKTTSTKHKTFVNIT